MESGRGFHLVLIIPNSDVEGTRITHSYQSGPFVSTTFHFRLAIVFILVRPFPKFFF